jgi:hypothetical protein
MLGELGVFFNNCAAAIFKGYNFVEPSYLIFTIQLTSQHPPYTRRSRDFFFECLNINITLFDLCGCESWSITLKENHRLKGV